MKKNIFDRMSDSYERFHLKESEIRMGNDSISVSPKLKLVLGWSVFLLCAVLAYVFVGFPFLNVGGATKVDKKDVLSQKVDTKNEHDTIVPYEKDADKELNAFIGDYFKAITSCDNEKLQDMVTDSSEYSNNESLKKKAEFITGYDNITVYTKEGLEEGSYVAFVVSNLTIAGVNSSPYDISKYIEKVKGDKDIQKIYKSVEKKNEALKEKDSSLQQFYEIISRRNVETNSVADQTSEQTDDATTAAESTEPASTEAETTEAPATEAPATETPATEAPATETAQ